ncbi:MAG: hypothetical protein JXP34_28270 [Planctomycetes bacterium]|nr:hypothetical protein [Planctomycetota bacterium]
MSARILLTLGLCAAIVGCTGGGDNSPSGVVNAFFTASKAKDSEKAKQCLTKESLKKFEEGEKYSKDEAPKGTWKILNEQIKGDTAEVTVKMQDMGKDMPDMEMDYVCVRQDGRWLIDLDGTMKAMMRKAFEKAAAGAGRKEGGGAGTQPPPPSADDIMKMIEGMKKNAVEKTTEPGTEESATEEGTTEEETTSAPTTPEMPTKEDMEAAKKAMEAFGDVFKKAMEEAAKKGEAPAPEPEEK